MAREPASRRGAKSAAAYRTISEVAEDVDVPAHVLRFWESKFPAVKPLKRGGGRRYYRPEDVEALRRIRKLLYEDGFTIRGVQKLLKAHGGKPPAGVAPAVAEDAPAPAPASCAGAFAREPRGLIHFPMGGSLSFWNGARPLRSERAKRPDPDSSAGHRGRPI